MTYGLATDTLRQLLRQAADSGEGGQQALTRLYRHYDPLIRAALPKGLRPQDAEDLVQDVWAQVVDELRHGRRLRGHDDVIALIQSALRGSALPDQPRSAPRPGKRTIWQRIRAFLRLLLPAQEP